MIENPPCLCNSVLGIVIWQFRKPIYQTLHGTVLSEQHTYYGLRRFCPYLGVIQVVDVGDASAYSTDGRTWQIRTQTASGRFRWGGAVVEREDGRVVQGTATEALTEAMRKRPELGFPLEDRYELWLLRKATRQPLALLKTRHMRRNIEDRIEPNWEPFLLDDNSFVSALLTQEEAKQHPRAWRVAHKDMLQRIVMDASRPLPVAQWFQRRADGSGKGIQGLRLTDELEDRELPAEAFPELLVDEHWDSARDRTVIQDFHDWNAGRLLAHQSLRLATRARLEKAACARPETVLENYAMYPEIIDAEALEVALVAARLMKSAEG